jgi:serine/threonine-protein kinase
MGYHSWTCEALCVESNNDKLAKTVMLSDHLAKRATTVVMPNPAPATAEADAPAALSPGVMLQHYLIVSKIGEGGMGEVFKAQDTRLHRPVALKVMPAALLRDPHRLHRYRTEAQAQARLNHPNVITLYSTLEVPAGLILIMEYVEGATLHQLLQSRGPMEVAEALHIFEQALRGIEAAHAVGIVHRDLKPDNIFITRAGEVKIMDFGVAKIVDNSEHTQTRSMVGTLLYISPEQINGREADFRSDIYTLGISLFETITGRLPFERRSDYALMHAHVVENPPSPKRLRRNLPADLEAVILKAIQKDPAKRYQSSTEFRTALASRLDAARAAATPTGWRERLQGMGLDIALMAMVAVLAIALGLYPSRDKPADTDEVVDQSARPSAMPAGSTVRRHTPPANNPKQGDTPSRDKYDSLRKAWGG